MSHGGRGRGVIALALLLVVTGCGGRLSAAGPTPAPYDGPLWIPPAADLDLWEDPGAAGRVVDCDFEVVGESKATPFTGGEVRETPEAALKEAYDEGGWSGVEDVQAVRREPDRILYTYAADGRTRQAVILRYGPAVEGTGAGADGLAWWVESWARCNIAEFPERVAEERHIEVWLDASGRRVPTTTITSTSDVDCVPGARFLELGVPGADPDESDSREVYVAGAGSNFDDWFAEPYRRDVTRPADAVDTGFQRDGEHLWLSPDHRRAYVVRADRVELWPRTIRELGCA